MTDAVVRTFKVPPYSGQEWLRGWHEVRIREGWDDVGTRVAMAASLAIAERIRAILHDDGPDGAVHAHWVPCSICGSLSGELCDGTRIHRERSLLAVRVTEARRRRFDPEVDTRIRMLLGVRLKSEPPAQEVTQHG